MLKDSRSLEQIVTSLRAGGGENLGEISNNLPSKSVELCELRSTVLSLRDLVNLAQVGKGSRETVLQKRKVSQVRPLARAARNRVTHERLSETDSQVDHELKYYPLHEIQAASEASDLFLDDEPESKRILVSSPLTTPRLGVVFDSLDELQASIKSILEGSLVKANLSEMREEDLD